MLVVTPGETALIAALTKRSAKFVTENMLIGDAMIKVNDTPVYIFERKSKGDLLASIKDGRYREQKVRLLNTGIPRKNIVYIIESLSILKNTEKTLWGAICNTQHRDGCTMFQTLNVEQTADYLVSLVTSIEKFPESNVLSETKPEINVKIKKPTVPKDQFLKHILTLIPRVSDDWAAAIVREYTTLADLKSVLTENPEALSEIRRTDAEPGIQNRRLGKILSKEISEYITNL